MNSLSSYLTGRGITVTMPPDIRYLPPKENKYGAMVAAARDNDGNISAVQRIFIQDGKKAPVDPVKRTNGVMDGAAVRLPGNQGDELVLAEGPETGLSVWQAWGRETWVALGSVAKLVDDIPTDRMIIIARDADVPNSQADKALNKAVMAMIERGATVFIAMPPNPTKPGYDFNDALQDYGDSAVAEALEDCRALHSNELPNYTDLAAARTETQRVISQFFDEAGQSEQPPVWLINIGLGIGKTRTTLVEAGKFIRATDKQKR
jgi:hypothetical protein